LLLLQGKERARFGTVVRGMADFEALREEMVERQLIARGISDPLVLEAFRRVPREMFVAADQRSAAYADKPLPIAAGQTISQPYIVALMVEAAEVGPCARVLEIGAGSGYAAAILAQIAGEVIALERHAELAALARERMARLGYANVRVLHLDGSEGLPEDAPFDAILAAASGRDVPDAVLRQLAIGGVLVMPVGSPGEVQRLAKVKRLGEAEFDRQDLGPVRFVPLIGRAGWPEDVR
jgi:protein-L-isoaspartate(D-aspartate) O-methyltransferase